MCTFAVLGIFQEISLSGIPTVSNEVFFFYGSCQSLFKNICSKLISIQSRFFHLSCILGYNFFFHLQELEIRKYNRHMLSNRFLFALFFNKKSD